MSTKNRKSANVTKSAKSVGAAQPGEPTQPGTAPESGQPDRVQLHDLRSFAVVFLPKELRALLGEAAYQREVEDIRQCQITMVHRRQKEVIFMHLPLMVMNADGSQPAASTISHKPRSKP